ncbi:MAG: flagellar biosynthesis regulator FlaF [Syntrophales bacterium]|nr:flagellar biosynthesis regulator FlaF [Syntrophales bacterium]
MDHSKLDLYMKVSKMNDSPRDTEARVLTKGALKLKECMDNWESDGRKRLLSEALHFNQKIWSIFQADLTSRECLLPRDMRLNLLKLGAFVDKQIFTVMAHPSPEKLAPIIDINLGLAAGLRKKPDIQVASAVETKTDDDAGNRLEIKG